MTTPDALDDLPDFGDDGYVYEPPPLPEVTLAAVLRRAPDVLSTEIADELVLYRPSDAVSYVFNRVAGLVWQCFDGESPLGDILADVAEVFGVESQQVADDFLPVVAGWLGDEIVQEVNGASDLAPAG